LLLHKNALNENSVELDDFFYASRTIGDLVEMDIPVTPCGLKKLFVMYSASFHSLAARPQNTAYIRFSV